jgi:pimeloyl-ACP methyl ester carboxylesterase
MTAGRIIPSLTAIVISALMSPPGLTVATAAPRLVATKEQPLLRDVQQERVTATDGTLFTITRAFVSVPELREGHGSPSGSIDLAVVRARRLGLLAMMREVIGRLTRTPAIVTLEHPVSKQPVTVTIGAFDVQWLTAQALADPRAMATLPSAYREMAAGDFRRLATLALMSRTRLGVESAMKHMMDLSSGATPARLTRIEREAGEALLGNAINFPGPLLADVWKPVDLGDEFRRPVTSDVHALILAGDLDPRTPIENGHEIVATLSRGRLITIENATHQFDVFGSAPIRAVLRQFLKGERISTDRMTLPLPAQ